jgi:hypothetical protein
LFHPLVHIETDRPELTYGCNNAEGVGAELMKWSKRRPKWKKAVKGPVWPALKARAHPT